MSAFIGVGTELEGDATAGWLGVYAGGVDVLGGPSNSTSGPSSTSSIALEYLI